MIWYVKVRTLPLSPASVFTLFWTSQILFMVIFCSGFLYFNYVGLIYIILCLLIFDIGYCTQIQEEDVQANDIIIDYNGSNAKRLYFIVLVFAFVALIYNIYHRGFGLENLFDFDSFLEMSNENSRKRYSGEEEGGALMRLLGVNTFACTILGGMSYYMFTGRKRFFSFISLLPMILDGLVVGAKMGIITGTFLWLIGLLLVAQLKEEELHFSLKIFLGIFIGMVAFVALLVIVMMFRLGEFDIDAMYIVFGKTISYALGHLPAFDLWFYAHEDVFPELTWGGKTFFGITNTLGVLERESGVFSDLVEVSRDGDHTNVFTVFRFLVEDFGTLGTLIYLYAMGVICRIIYNHFINKRFVYLSTTLLCGIYFFISWSFGTSIFAYATYIALLFYLYLLLKLFFRTESISCPEFQ